ncbi:hypothetical protein Chor_008684 [Crotalus horridus]
MPACGPARAVIAAAAAATAESPAGGGSGSGSNSNSGGGLGSAHIAGKKAQLRSAPRAKKLEKLGVYSACKGAPKDVAVAVYSCRQKGRCGSGSLGLQPVLLMK